MSQSFKGLLTSVIALIKSLSRLLSLLKGWKLNMTLLYP